MRHLLSSIVTQNIKGLNRGQLTRTPACNFTHSIERGKIYSKKFALASFVGPEKIRILFHHPQVL